ncbi:MAG: aa3-type cytochrome c oxidase subunit IV [Devosia sp.]
MAKTPTTSSRPRKTAAAAPAVSSHGDHGHASPSVNGDGTASDMDYVAHEAMFERFTGIVKWGMVACAVLVIFLFIVVHPMVPPPAS